MPLYEAGQYTSSGFSIQRDEIISIQQPKKTDDFYIQQGVSVNVDKVFKLSTPVDPYLKVDSKIRVWINEAPISRKDNDGTVKWIYSEENNTLTIPADHVINDTHTASIRVEYFRKTKQSPTDTSSRYEDGILRKLANDMCLHPYNLDSGSNHILEGNVSSMDQPYNLIYPFAKGRCNDELGAEIPSALNSSHCEELNGTWTEIGESVTIDNNGKQNVDELKKAINSIDNMFVVESEKGTDMLSSVKDVTNSAKTLPPTDGNAPAGLKVKRKPQKWRIRFYYDIQDNYLHVNVGTQYQILDNGKVSNTESRDGIKPISSRLPGELCDVYLDTQTGKIKNKSGFFRRQGKNTAEFEGSYPMSYRLTTSDHGTVFYMWDHASVGQDDDFAWFVIQRHVDNRTGRIDLEDGYSPVHCVYSPAKRPVNIGDKRWLRAQTGGLTLSNIYDPDGAVYNREEEAWIRWTTQPEGSFGGGARNDIFYIAGDNKGGLYTASHTNLSEYTYPFTDKSIGADNGENNGYGEVFYAAAHVNARLGTIKDAYESYLLNKDNQPGEPTKYPSNKYEFTIKGGNYPESASTEVLQSNFSKIHRPDRITIAVNRVEVEKARAEEFYIDSKGTVVWSTDSFNWSGTSRQSYVYDPVEHKIVFRTPLAAGDIVEMRYFNYSDDSSSLGTYMIEIPEDPELPEYNLNVNKYGKAIYRFVVRERDVFKPWDIHKSATMTGIDSPAIINPMEQMSITPARRFIYTFPSPLVTQRFVYATSELDLISYSSADSSAFSGQALIGAGNNTKYMFDRVYDWEKGYDNSGDILNFRAPYTWHSFRCSVGTCDGTGDVAKEDCNGSWVDTRQIYGWSGYMTDYQGNSVADSQVATNKAACEAANGYWTTPSRVYQGMMSTLENGNGMRIFMLVRGGPINPDYTDVVVLD